MLELLAAWPGAGRYWVRANKGLRRWSLSLSHRSNLMPIEINQIHSWVIRIESRDGHPISGASVTVNGGMPAHSHGLPTRPQVTPGSQAGDYLIEGLRFHMAGQWSLVVVISAAGVSDSVTIPLQL